MATQVGRQGGVTQLGTTGALTVAAGRATVAAVRWESLFADLEAELEAAGRAELDAEVADRTRRERAGVTLLSRLQAHGGSGLRVALLGGRQLRGALAGSGPGWLLLDEEGGGQWLVAIEAVAALAGLGAAAADVESPVLSRLDLGYALRGLARERARGELVLRDGSALHGTVDRVGRDALDFALHPLDLPRRAEAVQGVVTVPLGAVAALRSG